MNQNRCRCGDRAVTELRPAPASGDIEAVLVFANWCPACFRRRFGEALAAPDVREWIGLERARRLVERGSWR